MDGRSVKGGSVTRQKRATEPAVRVSVSENPT